MAEEFIIISNPVHPVISMSSIEILIQIPLYDRLQCGIIRQLHSLPSAIFVSIILIWQYEGNGFFLNF